MQYSTSDSDTMLYYRTRDYIKYLYSYGVVRFIMEEVKQQNPFTESILLDKDGHYKMPDDIMRSVGNSRESYVSFLLHYLEWTYQNEHFDTLQLYDDAYWTCSDTKEYSLKDRIRLFQQDVIYPITTYIIDRLREGLCVCYVLKQFSIRAQRFNTLQGVKNERDIQDKIALFLYDNGNENHREENSGNAYPDFLISDKKLQFVVEVKYVKAKYPKGKHDLEKWTAQLKSYMDRYAYHHGVLYIVSEQYCEYIWKNCPQNMSIMNVYIGPQKPNDIGKAKQIEVDVK